MQISFTRAAEKSPNALHGLIWQSFITRGRSIERTISGLQNGADVNEDLSVLFLCWFEGKGKGKKNVVHARQTLAQLVSPGKRGGRVAVGVCWLQSMQIAFG